MGGEGGGGGGGGGKRTKPNSTAPYRLSSLE